jgi:hypothetical protein
MALLWAASGCETGIAILRVVSYDDKPLSGSHMILSKGLSKYAPQYISLQPRLSLFLQDLPITHLSNGSGIAPKRKQNGCTVLMY